MIRWHSGAVTSHEMSTRTATTFVKFINDGGRYIEWDGVYFIRAFIKQSFVRVKK